MRFQFTSHRIKLLIIILLILVMQTTSPISADAGTGKYPETRFVTLSDLHYYDPALGISGSAFQKYLDQDRKMLRESNELLDTAISEIESIKADFVIISGDLTKDGERYNHDVVAEKLLILKQSGKKVFVIPGNHDINNGEAKRFIGDRTERVENISDREFSEIYSEFGYKEAIERDPDSLSYLAEPVPGLWLLALDSCKWRENKVDGEPHVDGVIYEKTLKWIESMLKKARSANVPVIVMLHHGIMEHYPGNASSYSKYLLDNYEEVNKLLSTYGVQLVFTGHFHAQDITEKTAENARKPIFDIETGSLVTAPCPYRIVEINSDQQAVIQSKFITSIKSHPGNFTTFAKKDVIEGTKKLADEKLAGYWVSEHDRKLINPQAAEAYATHLTGDEVIPDPWLRYDSLGLWGKFILYMQKNIIQGWYTDLPPEDNDLTIQLQPN